MLKTVLLLALFAADPQVKPVTAPDKPTAASAVPLKENETKVPDNFAAYFQRAEDDWAKGIAARELAIEKAEVAHRGAPANQKAAQRRKINDMKEDLADMKKTPARSILASSPQPGDIGIISSAEVYAVLDDKTLAVKARTKTGGDWAILKVASTKGIKTTKAPKATPKAKDAPPYHPHDIVWLTVEPTPAERELADKFMPSSAGQPLIVLEAIKPTELAKQRALYAAQ